MCEYEDFCFLLCAFLKNFCLVCSFRFHKTHSSLFISFITSPLKISLSFLPLFSKKLKILLPHVPSSLSSFCPKRWYERYKYLKRERISSFTHTKTHLLYKHNVCCYSTNRVHRRPQGHQGSGTFYFFFFTFWSLLSFFFFFFFFAMRRRMAMGDDEHHRRKCVTFLLTRARSWDAPNVHETLRIWTRGHTCTLFFFMCAFYRELYASCILSLRVCIFRRR